MQETTPAERGDSPLVWVERAAGKINWANFTTHTEFLMGSLLELLKPAEGRKGVMYWDPRVLPTCGKGISPGQMAWLKRNYIFILTEFWNGLITEVRKVTPDLSLYEFLMTKDLQDEIEYSKAGLSKCLPFSYSDLTPDLDDGICETPKDFDFVTIGNPRVFKQHYEMFMELPEGSSILWLNCSRDNLKDKEFGPYLKACLEVARQRGHKLELQLLPRTLDVYKQYARGRVALQLSSGEGNYRGLTEVLKCGVPALYVPYTRGGGARYAHPLRGKGGVGEPVYHIGELAEKAKKLLDSYGDYKPRRILELTSRKMVLSLMKDAIAEGYRKAGQSWDGVFYELSAWDPGRTWSWLDIRSIPEL